MAEDSFQLENSAANSDDLNLVYQRLLIESSLWMNHEEMMLNFFILDLKYKLLCVNGSLF